MGDEELLDRVFERVVAAREEGTPVPSTEELLSGREHLRERVEELQRIARTVARSHADTFPVVPGYTLLGELGRGGMGAVYLARQEAVGGRRVALKVLPATAHLSARARERFLEEARTIAHLRHPHVVTLYDVVAADWSCAYAMEWVQGASLAQIIDRLEARQAAGDAEPTLAHVRPYLGEIQRAAGESYPIFVCRIGIAVARALGELHRAGLVHRDVKPSNILLRRDGTPLLSDFGLVHAIEDSLTHSGFVGTTTYASPEQLAGDPDSLDARSDVYSLGVTLYRALALRLPFDGRRGRTASARTPTGMLRLIESGRSVPLRAHNRRLPRDLETILAKALEFEPDRRYASADEFGDDLERVVSLQPIRARPAGAFTRALKFLRRHRAAALGIASGSALSLALALSAMAYVFLVPRWVEASVREARLALMDPLQANLLFVNVYWGQRSVGDPDRSGLRSAVRHYESALRWSPFDEAIRLERDIVRAVLDDPVAAKSAHPAAPDDLRSAGLAAYLLGDVDSALRSWELFEQRMEPGAPGDSLVDVGLGILYLVRDEPARAYPRLRQACQAFPDVGFLTSYLADAALRCGDHDVAERLLDAAARMPRQDPLLALDRIRADLLAARGQDPQAEALYRRATPGTPANLHLARFLHARGRVEEALDQYVLAVSALHGAGVRAEYARVLDEWWAELAPEERAERIHASVGRSPWDARSLVARLRYYTAASEPKPVLPTRPTRALEDLGLAQLALVLDVEDSAHWNGIQPYPPLLVSAERWALRSPLRAVFARIVRQLAVAHALVRSREDHVASAPTFVLAGADAPCFEGLGDLPGGAAESFAHCISSDGSSIGGTSASGRSGYREPFVWRADTGMLPVGTPDGGEVHALSADGSIAVGFVHWAPPTIEQAFRWTRRDGGIDFLAPDGTRSTARGSSDDGHLVVGQTCATEWRVASTWSPDRGWTRLGSGVEYCSTATCLSRDGRWVGGEVSLLFDAPVQAVRWSSSSGEKEFVTRTSRATGISNDGTVVGYFENAETSQGRLVTEAMVWRRDERAQSLRDGGALDSGAWAIVQDGTWIAGFATSDLGSEAVVWDEAHRLYRLTAIFDERGVGAPAGWRLTACRGIVRHGDVLTICGDGTNPAGEAEAWIARVRVSRQGQASARAESGDGDE